MKQKTERTKHADTQTRRILSAKTEPLTAPTQKAGFRVPKTVLWLIKH